ncbi:MAG: response regulator [Planctomycetota bacterium]
MSIGRDVLIVDDELVIAAALAAALEARGHRVAVAASAEEALTMPEPEVLVADLLLQGMGGLDLFGELVARGGAPKAVFMTGLPTVEDCRRALRLGATEFLTKPFSVDELVRAVEQEGNTGGPANVAPARFERVYAAGPRASERAARDIGAWCLRSEVTPATRARVASVVAELVDNATRHGYDASGEVCEDPIELRADMDARTLLLEVQDHGRGFDAAGLLLERMTCSQSGLARVSSLAEDLTIRSQPDHGTRVRARFTVSTADFDIDGRIDLSELDHLAPDTSRELLATLADDPHAPVILSPALAVVVGRLLAGPDPRRALQRALWS